MSEYLSTCIKETQKDTLINKTTTSEGTFKGISKEYTISPYQNTEAVTEAVFKYLQEINSKELPDILLGVFTVITQEEIETLTLVLAFLQEIAPKEDSEKPQNGQEVHSEEENVPNPAKGSPQKPSTQPKQQPLAKQEPIFSSIFSLASSVNKTRAPLAPILKEGRKHQESSKRQDSPSPFHSFSSLQTQKETQIFQPKAEKQHKDDQGDKDQEQKQNRHAFDQETPPRKQRRIQKQNIFTLSCSAPIDTKRETVSFEKIATSIGSYDVKGKPKAQQTPYPHHGNIFIRFMALMARILGQAEAEAHDLYNRIKERTDNIDTLTLLTSKINSTKGTVDWTKDEEMKSLVDKVRDLGVDIPPGKYKWTEEEKKLLKENIQMKKDSMEKVTQLERTDMQRFLQEASQCHQARSNLLKLLKEIVDTIVHNLRP